MTVRERILTVLCEHDLEIPTLVADALIDELGLDAEAVVA